jgi:hypothetical protein
MGSLVTELDPPASLSEEPSRTVQEELPIGWKYKSGGLPEAGQDQEPAASRDWLKTLQEVDREAADIAKQLGRAILPLEARSICTARTILNHLREDLNQHVNKVQASALALSVQEVHAIPQQVFDSLRWYVQRQHNLESVTTVQPTLALTVAGCARYVPRLMIFIAGLATRHGATLVCVAQLERFKGQLPQGYQAPQLASLAGSVCYQHWRQEEVTDFVLGVLQRACRSLQTEMLQRRDIIADEERMVSDARRKAMLVSKGVPG